MRIAIVEDNKKDQESLRSLISEEAHMRGWAYIVETYPSGEAFLSATGTFDIIFLDVMMDGIDGLETARRFRCKDDSTLVVFVTVESGYAIDCYDVEAVAFLVKPVIAAQFHRVLDRLDRKLKKDVSLMLDPNMEIPAGIILYAAATDHCLKIHTAAKNYFPVFSMEELRTRLPDDGRFIECNRSLLVNLDHITQVDTKSALLDDGTRLPVSRRRRQALIDAIAAWEFNSAREDML